LFVVQLSCKGEVLAILWSRRRTTLRNVRLRMPNIRLSVEEQRRFVDLLLNPPKPTAALRRARKAHAKLIVE
jgi:uncharacterized protein (DUF1778 family)